MQKPLLSASVLLLIVLLAGADYMLHFNGQLSLPSAKDLMPSAEEGLPLEVHVVGEANEGNSLNELLQNGSLKGMYTVNKSQQTFELFDRFDLSPLPGIEIHKNELTGATPDSASEAMTIYEIQAGPGQGSLAYLNIKLALISQLASPGLVNEVTGYGQNALFYNAPDLPDTAFLLARQADTLLGFTYSKKNSSALQIVQRAIESLSKES